MKMNLFALLRRWNTAAAIQRSGNCQPLLHEHILPNGIYDFAGC
jgi:hypothetical protein